LINRPKIIEGESISSYIHRLAKANHHVSISSFSTVFDISVLKINNNDLGDSVLEKVSVLTKQNIDDLKRSTTSQYKQRWGTMQYNKLIMKNKIKFCPECVEEEIHHQLIWTLHPVTFCIKHECMLIDRCPDCDQRVLMTTFMKGQCECGFLYRHSLTKRHGKTSMIYKSQEDLQNKINGIQVQKDSLISFTFEEYLKLVNASFHLLQGLKSFIQESNETINAFHNKKHSIYDNQKMADAYANVYWMYDDFRINFYQVLDKFNEKIPHIRYEQKGEFEKLFK
jgi:hypothetical protein